MSRWARLDLDGIVRQILDCRPSFIFNTLIGDFGLRLLPGHPPCRRARMASTRAATMPVASCSLAEPELVEIGAEAAAGHLSSSVYFASIDTPANRAFVAAYRSRFPDAGPTSADAEASYLAVQLLARAVRRAGTAEMTAVRAALPHVAVDAPQGQVRIDRDNRHCYLTPRIGISNAEFGFDVIYEAPAPVKPDPYLVWQDAHLDSRPQRRAEPAPGGSAHEPADPELSRPACAGDPHPADQNRLVLETTLAKLGLGVTAIDPPAGQTCTASVDQIDVAFLDVDSCGAAICPAVRATFRWSAMIGHRIAQPAAAGVRAAAAARSCSSRCDPAGSTRRSSSPSTATPATASRPATVASLEARHRARRLVMKAVLRLMERHGYR